MTSPSDPITPEGEVPCVRCGQPTRDRCWGQPVCQTCYEVRSSCCPEFGPDDLTDPDRAPTPGPAATPVLCCGCFPALQRTLEFDTFRPGAVLRARRVTLSASGKATNAARALKTLGAAPRLLSFAGGHQGQRLRELLAAEKIPGHWVETRTETRTCQTLLSLEPPGYTELVEEAPPLDPSEWSLFLHRMAEVERDYRYIIVSGNLPPHAPKDFYHDLLARTSGHKVLLDTYGAPLLAALPQRPALIKINADELRATFNAASSLPGLAVELLHRGAGAVGVTQGEDIAYLVQPDTVHTFQIPAVAAVNPIGSGDTVNAGTVHALAKGLDLAQAFRFGLACGVSNALHHDPGVIQLDQVKSLLPHIHINPSHG